MDTQLLYWTSLVNKEDSYLMYCSDLLYFFARYLAEALLGILTKDSSLLYLVMLHGVSHTQKSLSLSTRKSGRKTRGQLELNWPERPVQLLGCHVLMKMCVCVWLFLTKSWVSTFFVQLGGAVRCVSCGGKSSTLSSFIYHLFLFLKNLFTVNYLWSVIDVTLTQHSLRVFPHQACAPCGNCSCPPGSGSHSQYDRLWCCSYQRSLNPWASPCSLPTVGGDILAEKQ